MEDLVTVASFSNYAEAKLAQGLLEDYKIKSMLQEKNIGSAFSGDGTQAGPHTLMVSKKDFDKAKEILDVF